MCKTLSAFAKDNGGATAIEYALLATLIGLATVAAITFLGTQLNTSLTDTASKIPG
ncbi:MAG: Flp family type IVb pilin [Ahrensia sp.]|nr:Flp family type IVb pilin [Ahrensia sp.]